MPNRTVVVEEKRQGCLSWLGGCLTVVVAVVLAALGFYLLMTHA